jgi:hypothetical protein
MRPPHITKEYIKACKDIQEWVEPEDNMLVVWDDILIGCVEPEEDFAIKDYIHLFGRVIGGFNEEYYKKFMADFENYCTPVGKMPNRICGLVTRLRDKFILLPDLGWLVRKLHEQTNAWPTFDYESFNSMDNRIRVYTSLKINGKSVYRGTGNTLEMACLKALIALKGE